ncbi:MAG: DUF6504 family protein [Armatimonadota bacterium]|nr:DUF6504 family protein [Armatimonadota bacterium]
MTEFVDEKIEVETAETFPRPVRFVWQGRTHEVVEILSEHVDVGYGMLPAGSRSRTWFNRRHRRYFTVKDSTGDIFEMYMDYADRQHKTWWLVKRESCQLSADS